MKKTKNSAKDWWEYTNTKCFQENARTFSKNYTTQEYVMISRLKKDYETFIKKDNFKLDIELMRASKKC